MPPACCLSQSQREAVLSSPLHHSSWCSWWMLQLLLLSSPGISPASLKLLSWMVQVMKKIRHMKREAPNESKNCKALSASEWKKGGESAPRPHREAAFPNLSAFPHSTCHKASCLIYILWNLPLQDFADDKLQYSCKFFYTFQLLEMSKVTRRAT